MATGKAWHHQTDSAMRCEKVPGRELEMGFHGAGEAEHNIGQEGVRGLWDVHFQPQLPEAERPLKDLAATGSSGKLDA